MPSGAILYDCEFLTAEGAQARFWCGPYDPDPLIAQIGAVRIDLQAPFDIADTQRNFVQPLDRQGAAAKLDPFFTKLTGISQDDIDRHGVDLGTAQEYAQQRSGRYASGRSSAAQGARRAG